MENDIKGPWIARDENYDLYIFREKPTLCIEDGVGFYHPRIRGSGQCWRLESSLFPEVTYKNSPQLLITTKADNV